MSKVQKVYDISTHEPLLAHTEHCMIDLAKTSFRQWAYIEQYPHHCTHCHGVGWIHYQYDPSPAGISLAPGCMTDSKPCTVCFEKNYCPRCSNQLAEIVEGEEWECSTCKWNSEQAMEADPDAFGFSLAECYCWEGDWGNGQVFVSDPPLHPEYVFPPEP